MVDVVAKAAVERPVAPQGGPAPQGATRPRGGAAQDHGARHAVTRWGPLVLWLGALLVGTWLFHVLGAGPLAAPPVDPGGWSGWLTERDALSASVALLRLLVLALSWYLVGATAIGIVARLARAARLVQVADALTLPFVRRLLRTTLGVSLATTVVAGAIPAGPLPLVEDLSITQVVLARAVVEGESVPIVTPASSRAGPRAASGDARAKTMHEPMAPPRRPVPLELLDRARDDARAAGDDDDAADGVGGEGVGTHVVIAGDSLWSIAEATLVHAAGARPGDRALARYWRDVVELNRDRLSDPQNPDLIFPGQVVRLPALPT